MAINRSFDLRRSEQKVFAAVAVLFPIIALIGFGPSYYLKLAFPGPPVSGVLIHLHAFAMTAWIVLFITQVYLISSKRIKVHQRLGLAGICLAALIVIVGVMTGAASAARGGGVPGIPPLSFLIVPIGDVFVFSVLFAGAVYYRKKAADHKRLILLTVLNFLPPALGRFPFEFAGTPFFFYGVPDVIAIGLVIIDTWKTGKLNKVFLAGALFMSVSHPLRLAISTTDTWLSFAAWLTSWWS